jgi:hypothetical protein
MVLVRMTALIVALWKPMWTNRDARFVCAGERIIQSRAAG